MTPAEKMARTLDSVNCNLDGEYRDDIPEDAAEMIRRLAAALVAYDRGLELVGNERTSQIFRIAYADALRDVKEQA